ncbi:response regulator transcription factor [Paenibacillus sp. NPDC058174]|uniref:response regulator transcription factor n=1 Tax=Paenibacillus sp. NPDC058174 TaxID=3346366 RepID=UPI0036DD5C1C
MTYSILLIEDDHEIIELLKLYLEPEYNVHEAANAQIALDKIKAYSYDLSIVDVMLPGIDGFQWVKTIRHSHYFPVLFLSARSQESDKILGLSVGADDYMTKPFNPLEVVARVQALLRRVHQFDTVAVDKTEAEEERLEAGELVLDTKSCTLYLSGQPVPLTSTEYKILALLMGNSGRVLTRKKIYEAVWDDAFAYDDNTIMVHLSNLREKIEPHPKNPSYIKTIRGLGYKFEAPVQH